MNVIRIGFVVGMCLLAGRGNGQDSLVPVFVESVHAESAGVESFQLESGPIESLEVETANVEHASPVELAPCNCGVTRCHGVCRDPGTPAKPCWKKPGDRDRSDCPPLRYRMDDCHRAGNPHRVAMWAKCSVDSKYSAWFVGGGAPCFRGRSRAPSEGTWGLDYGGFFGHAKVWLKYTRGRRQGGEGAYATDGEPKIVSRAHELLHLGH